MVYRASITAPIFGLRREIDRLFEDTFGNESTARRSALWAPVTDVHEDDREVTLTFELPGVSPDRVEITAENGVLTVQGEKEELRKENDEATRHHLTERIYGAFARSFQLPKGLDESKIEAQFSDGVLTIRIPKAAVAQPRRIQIKTGRPSTGESSSAKVGGQKQPASVGSGQSQATTGSAQSQAAEGAAQPQAASTSGQASQPTGGGR